MKKPRTNSIFVYGLTLSLFVSSLFNMGTYVPLAGMALTCLWAFSLSSTRAELGSNQALKQLLAAFLVITAFFLWFVMAGNDNVARDLRDAAMNNYTFMMLTAVFVFGLRSIYRALPEYAIKALKWVIILHDLALIAQTVVMQVTGRYIDFILPIMGTESRYKIDDSLNPILAFRPTGMFAEPSNFSAAVCLAAIGYIVLCRSRGQKASLFVLLLNTFAILLTQSTAGILQAALLLSSIVLLQDRKGRVWTVLLVVIGVVGFSGIVYQYFDSFAEKFSQSADIRVALLSYIYETRRGWDFLFGYGPFGTEVNLYQMAIATKNNEVASLNDAGLLNFFVVKFGIAGLLIPIWLFLKTEKRLVYMLFLALILSTKLSYMHAALYIGLLPLLMNFRPARPLHVAPVQSLAPDTDVPPESRHA